MIRDLDLSLKSMLAGEADAGSELKMANISFSVPDETWQGKGNQLDLNVYLYDIRENRALRSNERYVERTIPKTITQKLAPPRVDCAFLFTAWNKATVSDGEDKELQEHRLLSQVLKVLLSNPIIPAKYLRGVLVGQEPPLPVITARQDGLPDAADFWNALGSPVRPSINCVITLSLDWSKAFTGTMVISQVTKYAQLNKPNSVETEIKVGGRVFENPPNNPIPIVGAKVLVIELNRIVTTDSNGYFSVDNLRPGTYRFRAEAAGFGPKKVTVQVPAPKDKAYDIRLYRP